MLHKTHVLGVVFLSDIQEGLNNYFPDLIISSKSSNETSSSRTD